jgi:hypothetical protein
MSDSLFYLNRFDATKQELTEKALPEEKMRNLWGDHRRDIVGFYKKCYQFAAKWKGPQFREAMGEQGLALQKDLLSGFITKVIK